MKTNPTAKMWMNLTNIMFNKKQNPGTKKMYFRIF